MMLHEVNPQHSGKEVDFGGQTLGLLKSSKVKSVKIPEVVSTLPSGEMVDFGRAGKKGSRKSSGASKKKGSNDGSSESSGSKSTQKKSEKPAPESSEKAAAAKSKKKGADVSGENGKGKKKQLAAPSLPSGEKPNFSGDYTGNKQNKKQGKASKDKRASSTEETYAGSSFHSSPAALNLPKPSFKTSPKQANPAANVVSTPQMPVSQIYNPPVNTTSPVNRMNLPPNYIPQGYPLQVPPQGFPHYSFPVAPPQLPNMAPYPPQQFSHPMPPLVTPQDPRFGQRISFNELLGKSDH